MRRIKRYGNRKFYDTSSSRYVTLGRIAEMIRGGEDVEIIDHPTGRDITAQVLAQVVMEETRGLPLPASLLASIIRGSGDLLANMLEAALTVTLRRSDMPTRSDLDRLHAALDEIEAKIEDLERRSGAAGGDVPEVSGGPRESL